MNRIFLLFVLQLCALTAQAAITCSTDCNLPCGAEELICCAAQKANQLSPVELYASPEDYYNKALFNSANLDGFCKNPPGGSITTSLQSYYYGKYCQSAGSYYSYSNFIQAANTPIFNGSSPNGGFGCVGTVETRYKELSNFFATIAQETTSVIAGYTNDGLYFRYENGALKNCATTPGGTLNQNCTAPNSQGSQAPYTVYYPTNSLYTDMNPGGSSYTQLLTLGNTGSSILIYNIAQTPEVISFGSFPFPIATGDTAPQLNDPSVLIPQLWVGMGPKQLTGQSMFEFFGWYQNNIASPAQTYANFNDFVTGFLNNGVLGFQGAFWYWMFRINGYNYRPIHAMVTDPNRSVCHDIAAVTLMVNGGCNNYNPGRFTYYSYFNRTFNQPTNAIQCTAPGQVHLNSLVCATPLQTYCQPTTSPGPCT